MPAVRRGSTYIGRHVSFGSGGSEDGDDDEAAERLSLVFEILRLEKSMNNALTSARDEMEGLTATVSEKEAEVAALEGELEGLRRENEALGAAAGKRRAPEQNQRSKSDSNAGEERKLARRPSFAASFLPRAKSEGLFGRSFKATRQEPSKWDDSTQHTPATDASGDSGSGYLPAAVTARLKPPRPVSSSRRASIDDPNDPHSMLPRARFDESGRSGSGSALSRRATLDVSMIENGCARLRAELSSREERLQELHGEKKANEEKLRSLREEAAEGRVQSERRHDEHAARVEALQKRKCDVTGSVRDKERLLAEMEESLKEAEERAAELEVQAEDGRARLREMEQRRVDERRREDDDDSAGEPPSLAQLERDIRECKIRHAVHCSHMKAAVDSLRHVLVVDKADDPSGLLGRRRLADLSEEEREEVGALVDEIAQDVDIQLSNIGRMMTDMRDRMEEYRLLSEPVAGGEEGCDEGGRQGGGNELLALSRECADVFGSFSDEVLRAVSSTSMNPTSGGSNSAEDAGTASAVASGDSSALADDAFGGVRSILESIQRRKETAELVREREGVETKIAIVQGEIKRVQKAMEEENRLHEEVIRKMTSKLDELTEGL